MPQHYVAAEGRRTNSTSSAIDGRSSPLVVAGRQPALYFDPL